jgi:hypothetical protein
VTPVTSKQWQINFTFAISKEMSSLGGQQTVVAQVA